MHHLRNLFLFIAFIHSAIAVAQKGYPFYDDGFTQNYCLQHEFLYQRIDEWMAPPLYEDFIQNDIRPPYTTLAVNNYDREEKLILEARYDSLSRMITANILEAFPDERHFDIIYYDDTWREVKVHRVGYKQYRDYNIHVIYNFNKDGLVTLMRRVEDCCHDTERIRYHYNTYGILDTVSSGKHNYVLQYEVITNKDRIQNYIDSFTEKLKLKKLPHVPFKFDGDITLYRLHTTWGWKSIFTTANQVYVIYPHFCEHALYTFSKQRLISVTKGIISGNTEKQAMRGFTAKRKKLGWNIDSNNGDFTKSINVSTDSVVYYDYSGNRWVQKRS